MIKIARTHLKRPMFNLPSQFCLISKQVFKNSNSDCC
jgi:hypothetical protein